MKRWTRAFLAILLGVFGAAYVGMVPARAANRDSKPDTVITYRGYTLSWSEIAGIYFIGVRLFGAPFYNSNPVVPS
jgi:hypothetical protein